MKKAKLMLSLALCALLLVLTAAPGFAAERSGRDVPNIHVRGMAGDIVNAQGEPIDERAFPEGGLAGMVKDCMPSFLNALKKNDKEAWDAYRAKLFPAVKSCFGPMWLDNNGEATDGSDQDRSWKYEQMTDRRGADGYGFDSYPFFYDWRLDPLATADELNTYIQQIKAVTGSDKVNINARCEGTNVLLAYFAKYGYADVNCAEFYAAASKGSELADALFSGHIHIDGDALVRYKDAKLTIDDELTNELVNALIEFTGDTLLLDVAAFSMDLLFMKLYDEVIAPLVLETYGTFPSFWAMVSEEDYPAARRNIFKGKEDAYAGLIEKIDRYDTDVRQHMDELMKGAKEAGVKIAVFAKYGDYLIPPVTENANELSDNTLLLSKASFGATTAKYGSILPQAVLDKAAANGTDKYISPDKMVDASTCMFPDTTWFFWDCPHETFPDFIFDAMAKFYYADGDMTVFSDPDFPQYQIAHLDPNNSDIGTLEPMNADNAPVIVTEKRNLRTVDWKDMILRLLKAVWAFLFNWLKNR